MAPEVMALSRRPVGQLIEGAMDLPKGRAARIKVALLPAIPGAARNPRLLESGRDLYARLCGAALDGEDFGVKITHEPHYRAFLHGLQGTNAAGETRSAVLMRGMADERREVLAFLNSALRQSGLKAGALAKRAGLAPTTITRFISDPENHFVPKMSTLRKIAEAAGVDLPNSINSTVSMDISPIRSSIPVLGTVRAGSWERIPDEPVVEEWLPVEVPEYAGANLFALRVEGRSMDLVYADGSYVICAHPSEAGLQVGDHVVCRQGDGMGKFETTLKEITQKPDGSFQLTPRSTDISLQPRDLVRNADADDGVEIIGVVVVQYAHAKRGRGPLVSL